MLRYVVAANVILLVLISLAVTTMRREWSEFEAGHRIDAIVPDLETSSAPAANPATAESEESWRAILDQNPFSFDRNDIPLMEAVEDVRPVRPKPFLFGVMSLGEAPIALLGPGDPGNRAYRAMRIGDVIDGWKLVAIEEKSAIVEGGSLRETILMNDPTAQIPRTSMRTNSTVRAPAQTVASPTTSATQPVQPIPEMPAPAGSAPATPGAAAPGTRVIETPFGRKVVPIP